MGGFVSKRRPIGTVLRTQAAPIYRPVFFDYDLDGDLDCYLLNNDCDVPTDTFPRGDFRKLRSAGEAGGDKLLRNDGGHFSDVSESAGIYSTKMGLGLGVSVGDIDGDHWPDIYVSNDFFEKDYLYINQQDGTFKEKSDSLLGHMSLSSMGADIADIDNDGHMDIFSTDMLPEGDYRLKKNTRFDDYDLYNLRHRSGYHYQLLGNMLHVNRGDGTFGEVARMAGIQATDWSWGALVLDLDNDGRKDILVCNGVYLSLTDNDFIDFLANDGAVGLRRKDKEITDYDLLKLIGISDPISNYAFINQGGLRFGDRARELGLGEPGYSNGGGLR